MQQSSRIMPPSSPAAAILSDEPKRRALFLDVDGTVLDIAPTPDQVVVPPGLVGLLERVREGLDGAFAILTGRQLGEIDELLAPAKFMGAGVHGAEMRLAPGGPIERVATALPETLAQNLIALSSQFPGIIAEPKGPGFAVHYRQVPELKTIVHDEIKLLLSQYPDELVLCPGRKLFEVIPAGLSKGSALVTLASTPVFAGRKPIMVGDDVGDEPALAAADRLGGSGLRVAGEHFGRTNVDLAGPAGVIDWLEHLAARLES